MLNNVLDPVTGLPLKFGELFSDRNLKLVGLARWNAASQSVETRNLSLILSPLDGGSPAITAIPDGLYPIDQDASIWVQVRRTAGTTTVVQGSSLVTNVSSQEKPRQNWVQLFIRTRSDEIVTFGNWLVLAGTTWTRIGVTLASGAYDAIVGSADNPFATHTSIQAAIDDALDGSRILVLQGTYSIETSQKPEISTTAAFAWSGKTVTIEGEGFSTIIQNSAGLTTAFHIQSNSSTATNSSGNGSKITNVHLRDFPQSVILDGGVGNGVRFTSVDVFNTSLNSSMVISLPSKIGTGTFDVNTVKESILRGTSFSLREHYLANSVLTDTKQAIGNDVMDGTSVRRLSVKTSLRVGDTSVPTRTLDVIGDVRSSAGEIYTPASSLRVFSDVGSALPVKAQALLASNNYADTPPSQGLLVRGNAQIDGSLTLNSGTVITTASAATSLSLVNETGVSLPLKAGSLVLSSNYTDTAPTQSLLVRGTTQVDGTLTLTNATVQTSAATANILTSTSPAINIGGTQSLITLNGYTRIVSPLQLPTTAGSETLDCSTKHIFYKSGGAATITLSNLAEGQNVSVAVSSTGVAYSLTWQADVPIRWAGASVPAPTVTASRVDIYNFIRIGNIIFGTAAVNFAVGANYPASVDGTSSQADANLTITSSFSRILMVTCTAVRTWTLPSLNINVGDRFEIINFGTSALNVNASNATLKIALTKSRGVFQAKIPTPTTPAHWAVWVQAES